MNRHLARAGIGAGAAALVVSSLLVTASAAHAADGTVTVTVVDQYGRPTSGILYAIDSGGTQFDDNGGGSPSTTHAFTLAPGGYGFESITPWSGVVCDGVSPCDISGSPAATSPVVTVGSGSTGSYTMHVNVPSVTGSPVNGSPLAIQIPPGLATLQALVSAVPGSGGGNITQQWVRGATDIAGATSLGYTTVRDDGGQAVSARLIPSQGMITVFASAGLVVSPFTTNAVNVAKAVKFKTKTTSKIAKRIGVGEKATLTVKVKAKGTKAHPDGFVTVTIGNFKARKSVKGGSAFITLPGLSAGTYTILAQYAGSEDFKKSKAKKITITVRR